MSDKRVKVGLYINNKKYPNTDFSNPQNGNPGVGGVEYMFSLINYYLADYFDTYVLANNIDHFSNKTSNIKIDSIEKAFKEAENNEIDYLICRSFNNKKDYDLLNRYNCKVIIWGHNFSKINELNWISKCTNIVKYVCVSKQQLGLLIGHPVYKKSTYIFNGLPLNAYVKDDRNTDNGICYIGAIIKGKGFDACCKVWRKLYDNGYKVKFNVIGSAKLYNSSKKLGKYDIATQDYENEFIKYLTDDNGELLDCVNLYGVLDHEKKVEVINNSYMGISASSEETFGLIAIECETLGKPFIALKTLGFIDTVYDYNNNLADNEDDLYSRCLYMLNLNSSNYGAISDNCIEFSKKFDINIIIKQWAHLIDSIYNNTVLINDINKVSIKDRVLSYINLIIKYH